MKYRTTVGSLDWDYHATRIEVADDPKEPEESGNWKLIGSVIGALRNSAQPVLWFWASEE